jgi:hypothetical protein
MAYRPVICITSSTLYCSLSEFVMNINLWSFFQFKFCLVSHYIDLKYRSRCNRHNNTEGARQNVPSRETGNIWYTKEKNNTNTYVLVTTISDLLYVSLQVLSIVLCLSLWWTSICDLSFIFSFVWYHISPSNWYFNFIH